MMAKFVVGELAAIRLAIKEAFDQEADGESRKALVPETMVQPRPQRVGA